MAALSFINTMLLFCTLSELFRVYLWTLNVSFTCFTPFHSFFFLFLTCLAFLWDLSVLVHIKMDSGGATAPPPRTEQRRLRWKAKGLANVQKLWPGRIKQL